MNPQLDFRIREVYKEGNLSEPDESAYYGQEYSEKVELAVKQALHGTNIRFEGDWSRIGRRGRFHLAFTCENTPKFSEWVAWNNTGKISWIEEHNSFYPVLWVDVSKVFPTFSQYYNIWQPRGKTDYLDAVISNTPFDSEWADFESRLAKAFNQIGICSVDELDKFEETWVTDEEYCDEKGNELPDDEVRIVRVNVWTCLFPQ